MIYELSTAKAGIATLAYFHRIRAQLYYKVLLHARSNAKRTLT